MARFHRKPVEDKKPLETERHLTVGQLRAYLANLPDSMPIETEGCDCIGPCGGARVDIDAETQQAYLIMNRNDGIDDDLPVGTSN